MATHDMVTVTTKNLTWTIKSSKEETLAEGTAKNDAEMKRQIKAALKVQGVVTNDEVRKGKTLVIPE
jgi:hypothetical protein